MKRKFKLIIMLIISSLLTGCWDYKDINKRNITLTVGVDEVDDMKQFTCEIAKFSQGGNEKIGGSQNKNNYTVVSMGRSFEEAKKEYDFKYPLQDFSGAIRVIIFGRSYAESGIESYINRVNHLTELRKSLPIVISREAPEKLLQKEVVNDTTVGYAIEDTIRQLYKNGKSIYKTAQEIQEDIQNKEIGYVIPYIGMQDKTIDFLGLAVMSTDNKMIEVINRDDCNGFLYLLPKKTTSTKAIYKIGKEDTIYSVRTILQKRKIKTSYIDKKINIDIDLKLSSYLQYQYYTKLLNESIIKELEDEITKEVKKEVLYAISRSQKELKVDIFDFSRYFKADNPKAYKEINWKEEYPSANINVNVKTKIKDVNLINLNKKKKY
ncbi:Ger(x)C family spore germination protein [Clostridium sp. JNZ J1-5]